MNERDKTAQMMQDSSGQHWGTEAHFQRFAALIRADEREACAKVCEPSEEHRREASWGYLGGEEGVKLLDAKAADIRARGNT